LSEGLRILALAPDAFGGRGGIAQYNRDLMTALAGDPLVGSIEIVVLNAPDPVQGLPARTRQRPAAKGRVKFLWSAFAAALAARPDVVFCGHLHLAPWARALARLTAARLVVQLHGIEAWKTPSTPRRRAVDAADLVLCVSRYTRGRLLGWSVLKPEKAVVHANTVSADFVPGDREAARQALELGAASVLLSVGRLSSEERYKGQEKVISLLPRLREARGDILYVIAGEGDDLPRLQALARSTGVEDDVRFIGHVSRERLPDLYRAADLFVLPSSGEGFGIVFLEAMACGTPAVGLAVCGAVDALADGELGAAVPAEGLYDAIIAALERGAPDRAALAREVDRRFGQSVFAVRSKALFASLAKAA